MKPIHTIKAALLSAVLFLSSCAIVQSDVDTDYNIPRSAALVSTSAYLDKNPSAMSTLSQVADKLAVLSAEPAIPVEDVIAKVAAIVNASTIKNKTACIALVATLLNEYHVTALTAEDYAFILKEISDGIIEAIDLYVWNNPTAA